MKKLNANEMRAVAGGRWRCMTCGRKYWSYIQAVTHINCTAHYVGMSVRKSVKWCW